MGVRILIVCREGLSAALYAKKVMREMGRHGVAATVDSSGVAQAPALAPDYHMVLLAPQAAAYQDELRDAVVGAGARTCIRAIGVPQYQRKNARQLTDAVLVVLGQ